MNKIFSIASTVLATVVMGTALVYYNFIDKPKGAVGGGNTASNSSIDQSGETEDDVIGVAVGDVCPDFTVDMMVATDGVFGFAEEDYNLREHNGKVRVINFWATWCSACKHELPYFNDFAVAYPEVEVIAVCGASGTAADVQKWMNNAKWEAQKNGWCDFDLTFGYYDDTVRDLYTDLGGTGFWPMTVIVDEEGVIRYSAEVEMDFEKLENAVLPLLND